VSDCADTGFILDSQAAVGNPGCPSNINKLTPRVAIHL
jgi:hypothetical protein